jgi:DNA polymerase-4
MDIFNDLASLVEPLSLDEAFLDVTHRVTPTRAPQDIARYLKHRVKDELGLTISVGVATTKSVAKIASDLDKPDGLTVVAPGTEREFLAPLAVGRIWGVGPKTQERLKADGIETIAELALQSEEWMRQKFGRNGPHMRELALGIDDRPVEVNRDTKSVSSETTLVTDTGDADALEELVNRLSHDVAGDLESKGLWARTVKLKLRLSDFTTFTRQITVQAPVQTSDQIAEPANALMRAELGPNRLFRLVGVGVSGFDQPEEPEVRQPRLPGF